jgi:hypothetical protein
MDKLRAILDKASYLLQGEPLRAIGYGTALVIVGVVAVANALGVTKFGASISLADALVLATTATGTLVTIVEGARRYVFSPNSVAEIVAATPAAAVSQDDPAVVEDETGPTV